MRFKVEQCEIKNSVTSGPFKRGVVKDEGNINLDVSVWPDAPFYNDFQVGNVVEAEIREKGKYKNLVAARNPNGTERPYGRSPSAMTKVMEKKAGMIAEAQGNKELGIKVSSTMRMAVDCAIAEYNGLDLERKGDANLHNIILEWRSWLWKNWDHTVTDEPPF